jgi:DNA-binding protein HU-beta
LPITHTQQEGKTYMTKNDLITKVAEKTGLQKKEATKAIDAVCEAVIQAVAKGDEVRLVGFGTFSGSKRQARTGRNPRTGEPLKIAASTTPRFKAGKEFKDAVAK